MYLDKKRVIEDADVLAVVYEIGMPIQSKGNQHLILCPGHEEHCGHPDSNFGSCMLFKQGYYCFSVNQYYNVVDMVMQYMRISGNPISEFQAMKIIVSASGGKLENYIIENGEVELLNPLPFSPDDMKRIGFYNRNQTDLFDSYYTEEYENCVQKSVLTNNQGVKEIKQIYFHKQKFENYTTKILFNENPILFYQIIIANCDKALYEAQNTINVFEKSPWLLNKNNLEIDYHALIGYLNWHVRSIKEIKERAINNMAYLQNRH